MAASCGDTSKSGILSTDKKSCPPLYSMHGILLVGNFAASSSGRFSYKNSLI